MMGGAFVTNVAEKLQEICKKRLTQTIKSDILIFVGASFIINSEFNILLCASGSVVEHLLAKEGVAGSIPVSRSFYF